MPSLAHDSIKYCNYIDAASFAFLWFVASRWRKYNICTVDHIHGSISATLCNLLQVGLGADEAQTGAPSGGCGRSEGSVAEDRLFILFFSPN